MSLESEPARQPGRLRAWGTWLLQVVISTVLLAIVFRRTDTSQLPSLMARAHWGWWTCGLGLVLLAPVPVLLVMLFPWVDSQTIMYKQP